MMQLFRRGMLMYFFLIENVNMDMRLYAAPLWPCLFFDFFNLFCGMFGLRSCAASVLIFSIMSSFTEKQLCFLTNSYQK